jgi:hypothetical protein
MYRLRDYLYVTHNNTICLLSWGALDHFSKILNIPNLKQEIIDCNAILDNIMDQIKKSAQF